MLNDVIVCHCRAVNDHRIRELVASGVVEVESIAQVCDAGTDCGGCHALIEELINVSRPVAVSVGS